MTTQTIANLATVFQSLRGFDAECVAKKIKKNDRAIVVSHACIARGVNKGADIIEMLAALGFRRAHARLMLNKCIGKEWVRSSEGIYASLR